MESETEKLGQDLLESGAPSNGAPTSAKKRGRPPLPRDADGNIIRDGSTSASPRSSPRTLGKPKQSDKFEYSPNEKTIRAVAKMCGTLWYLASPFMKARPLSDTEALLLAEDVDPILQKYVPMYDDWKYEINLSMTLVGLYQIAHEDYMKEVAKGNVEVRIKEKEKVTNEPQKDS